MTLRGYVKDGVVAPDAPSRLEDGAGVGISASGRWGNTGGPSKRKTAWSLGEVLERCSGAITGLPRGVERNHDHLIHGAAKRK